MSLPLTVSEARELGFRTPRNEYGKRLDALLADVESRGDSYLEAFEACHERARHDPLFADSPSDLIPFSNDEMSNPILKAAADEWYECMKPLGAPDLERGYPHIPDSLIDKFVSQGVDNPDLSDVSTISTEEVETATFIARCYEESNFSRIAYDLNWVGEEQYLLEHKAEYQAILDAVEQHEQKLKDYIDANRHLIS